MFKTVWDVVSERYVSVRKSKIFKFPERYLEKKPAPTKARKTAE